MDLQLRNQFPNLETRDQFEHWLDSTINSSSANRIIGGVYQIPVVFQVIHNGEAVGVGSNISYAAIQSQIDVLNEDFRRIVNTNGYNTNPVGADTEIEFCLAKRRPDGSAFPNGEDGVNRINRTTAGFTAPPFSTNYIDATIKTYTYNNNVPTATRGWNPGKYMNIWICNISGGTLGYAQFPQSPLGGMGCGAQTTATDGVVFTYTSIGKSAVTGFAAPYNEGRTATHEIGHWLGLRHIWGDGGCTVDDFCNDTPVAGQANYGCPTGENSCTALPGNDMIENYMDYTDDLCMNIFTNDQKTRMRTVLESSPLRVSLINSDACIPPSTNDASIIDILNPKGDNCPGSIAPSVIIKNRGTNVLTSATISYQVDNGAVTNFAFNGNVASGSTATVTLPAFASYLGTHSLKVYSTLPNGVVDPSTEYDTTIINFIVSNGISAPYTQNFEANVFPPDLKWVVENENSDCYEWLGASATSILAVENNNTAQFPGFGNNTSGRESLVTPIFILPCNATNANIQFDVAYRRRNNTTSNYERLFIEISENCGQTWNSTPIYDKSGTSLQVSTNTSTSYYTPLVVSDWRTETIDLSSFISSTSKNVKFRFRAVAANGNNIYLDNFKFNATSSTEILVTQNGNEIFDEGGVDFGQVTIGGTSQKTFTVKNNGTSNLTLNLPLSISGTAFTVLNNNLSATIAPGASQTFDVLFSATNPGAYSETLSLTNNDCDEGVYNFLLLAEGRVNPPVANFSSNSLIGCTGSTFTMNNLSADATSYEWDFGVGATPQTSTSVNPTVSFSTNGTHTIRLIALNQYGSDTLIQTAYITTLAASTLALPLNEGFVSGTFPPANWTIVNNNASTTWDRSSTVGNAPTAGNSIIFDNYNVADADDDEMRIPGVDLSSMISAQMTFDVAYAPYNTQYFDGLEVLVSTDCGSTFSSVYLKSNTVLATRTATTANFVPTTTQWRTESIDLSAFVGSNSVIVSLKNLAGNGNNLYIDNINITGVLGTNPPVADFSASQTTICVGSTVNFTDLSTNSPSSWSWTINGGTPSSSTSANPSVIFDTPGTYDVVLTATNDFGSNTITKVAYIVVNPSIVPAVSIASSDNDNSICQTNSVTFTASPVNGGSNPVYQWQLNGANVGNSSANYSNSNLADGDVVTCMLNSNAACANPMSAASNAINTNVIASVLPTISISSDDSDNSICEGTNVTFTAVQTNGGSNPIYEWFLNGNTVGSDAANYSASNLNNGDLITCQLNSNELCASPSIVLSNAIAMTVNTTLNPTVSITSNDVDNSICENQAVSFSANTSNLGSTTSFEWKVNGTIVSTTGSSFTSSNLANGDLISCDITTNSLCASTNVASSNVFSMQVIATVIPSVTISSDDLDNEICDGTVVNFTANAINGGTATYQWKVNGTNVGTSNPSYSNSNLNDLDVISCQITSTALCASPSTATSNAITVVVNPNLSPSISIVSDDSDNIIAPGTIVTFTATISNGGNNPSFQWMVNGSTVGTNAAIFTSSNLQNGDIVSCQLTSDETCITSATAMSNDLAITVSNQVGMEEMQFVDNQFIFPNPFQDAFSIKLKLDTEDQIEISVFDISGKIIESLKVSPNDLMTLNLGANYKAGMYNLHIKNGDVNYLFKVVKH